MQGSALLWSLLNLTSSSLLAFSLPSVFSPSHEPQTLYSFFYKKSPLHLKAPFFLFYFQCLCILLLISWQTSPSRHLFPNVTRLAQLESQDSNPDPMIIYQCLSSPPSLPSLVPVHVRHTPRITHLALAFFLALESDKQLSALNFYLSPPLTNSLCFSSLLFNYHS